MARTRKTVISADKDVEKLEPLYTVGNVKWCNHFGKQFGNSSKCKIKSYHMTLDMYTIKVTYVHPKTCIQMFIAALFMVAPMWN